MLRKEKKYTYFEAGEGTPIIILHGLMGGLSNFDGVANFFPLKGYKVVIPELPIYTQNILKTILWLIRRLGKYCHQHCIGAMSALGIKLGIWNSNEL